MAGFVEALLPASQSIPRENGSHEGTRTPDLCQFILEVSNLKPFASLPFPLSIHRKNAQEPPGFGYELVSRNPSFPSGPYSPIGERALGKMAGAP